MQGNSYALKTSSEVTTDALTSAHQADLDIQADEGVQFVQAWADPATGHVFCLSEAPDADAVQRIHTRAGHPADEIHEIAIAVQYRRLTPAWMHTCGQARHCCLRLLFVPS